MTRARLGLAIAAVVATGVMLAAGQSAPQPPGPARDTPAQPRSTMAPLTGRIGGRVLAADTGRPVAGARVFVSGPELPGGRAEITGDDGSFLFVGLPAGRYSVTVSRSGFVGLSYGQRRPLQPGTPLQLADGQNLAGIDFRLPRGSVISGHVYDQIGDPMPGTMVRVLRYQYVQGNRQLVPAGAGQTDDRGEYRVWGLNPGDYYVSAVTPTPNVGAAAGRGAGPVPVGRGAPPPGSAPPARPDESGSIAYAPTYFPGVSSPDEARPVPVGLSAEVLGIDFNLLRVRTSVVSGRVVSADGSAARAGSVTLALEGQSGLGGGRLGGSFSVRIQGDGSFTVEGVPPGRYLLRATGDAGRGRGGSGGPAQFASQPIAVDGDVTTHVTLAPGATITGSITLRARQGAATPPMDQFRVSTLAVESGGPGGNPSARVGADGTFNIGDVSAGPRLIRAQAPRGWMLRSVTISGRDVTDTPIDVRSASRMTDVTVEFTDALSEIAGTVTDQIGTPVIEYTVLAFPRDASLWRPQARHIMTARPDQTGRFQIRGLPPGDYYVAVVDPLEQGEWFEPAFLDEHRRGAVVVTLNEGDVKTQDFRIATR
jgi:hypothetical protein